jgi:hypothetical protein
MQKLNSGNSNIYVDISLVFIYENVYPKHICIDTKSMSLSCSVS